MKTKLKQIFDNDDGNKMPTDQEFNDLLDTVKTESFGALRKFYGGTGRFAETSVEDMREAGAEAGKALDRIS